MLRRIIKIDEEKCTGCGACAAACHEGAIEMRDGKARLAREDYCDGLGDCLPECPAGAIRFETREAPAYDEAAVRAAKRQRDDKPAAGCPGAQPRALRQDDAEAGDAEAGGARTHAVSRLAQWPCQIKLAPTSAPYFAGADLLVAADCTAYACASFHEDYMRGRVTLVGCPKLDAVDYAEKLAVILQSNDVRSVTVARMQVPCCGGLEMAVRRAIAKSGKPLPLCVVTLGIDGKTVSVVEA